MTPMVHLVLSGVGKLFGFLVGAAISLFISFYVFSGPVEDDGWGELWRIALFFVLPYPFIRLSKRLFKSIPARYPRCGGDAYRTDARVITYTFRQCNHDETLTLSKWIRR